MSSFSSAPVQREPAGALVSISPGLELSYVDAGDPGGVPVILLHGYSDSYRSWLPLMAALPPSFRLIALTQRGHGDSGKPSDGYETSRFADDLAAFMNMLDIPRAVLVGHSFGTLVAMRFAIDRPGRVLGLALLGGFRTLAGNPGLEEVWDEIAGATDAVDPGFVRAFQESTLAHPIPAEHLESAIAESQKVSAHVWKAVARNLLSEDFSGEIARISASTLILWGEEDEIGRAHV